jgi:hypothetical protein
MESLAPARATRAFFDARVVVNDVDVHRSATFPLNS